MSLEQGDLLEKNEKLAEASMLYWEIVKGDTNTYNPEMKKDAKERIVRLNNPAISANFKTEIKTNTDPLSKKLICDLIFDYNLSSDYSCIIESGLQPNTSIENKKYFANSLLAIDSDDITNELISLHNVATDRFVEEIIAQEEKGITNNLVSNQLLSYYQFVALYNNEKTLTFLLDILKEKNTEDLSGLIQSMSLINNDRIIAPLIITAKDASVRDKKNITDIFLSFNDAKTYSYLIQEAVLDEELAEVIIAHIEKNLTSQTVGYIAETFKKSTLPSNATLLAKSLIKKVPSKESVSALSKLLELKNVPYNEQTSAEVNDILKFINKNMTKDNMKDLLLALGKNLATSPTNDFYAMPEIFEQNISLINQHYENNTYLRSFVLELKKLSAVYKANKNFSFLVDKARSSEDLTTIKELLEDIVKQTATIASHQPASKMLTNIKFYASKVTDKNIKYALNSVLKNSGYEKKINADDSLNTLNINELSKDTSPSSTNINSN